MQQFLKLKEVLLIMQRIKAVSTAMMGKSIDKEV
jgi:hypothetical protein